MADHVLGDLYRVVHLAVVNLKGQADEVGQDSCRARLRADGRWGLAILWSRKRETMLSMLAAKKFMSNIEEKIAPGGLGDSQAGVESTTTYGTMFGPGLLVERSQISVVC